MSSPGNDRKAEASLRLEFWKFVVETAELRALTDPKFGSFADMAGTRVFYWQAIVGGPIRAVAETGSDAAPHSFTEPHRLLWEMVQLVDRLLREFKEHPEPRGTEGARYPRIIYYEFADFARP